MARLNILHIPSYKIGFNKTAKQCDKMPALVKGKSAAPSLPSSLIRSVRLDPAGRGYPHFPEGHFLTAAK
jgi:hypothetical protein